MYLPSQPKHGRTFATALPKHSCWSKYIRTHTGWLAAQRSRSPHVVEGGARPPRWKDRVQGETHRCAGAVGLQLVDVAGGGFRSSRSPEAVVFKVAR